MKPILALAVAACVTGCARPTEPPVIHVSPPPIVVEAPAVEHVKIPKNEPVARTLERAKWHADYAAGLIKAHRAKEGN